MNVKSNKTDNFGERITDGNAGRCNERDDVVVHNGNFETGIALLPRDLYCLYFFINPKSLIPFVYSLRHTVSSLIFAGEACAPSKLTFVKTSLHLRDQECVT